MAKDDHVNLEPPVRTSIDDPGAHDLGKDLQIPSETPLAPWTDMSCRILGLR